MGEAHNGVPAAVVDGFVAPGFEPVQAAFERNFAESPEVGAAVCVLVDGRPCIGHCPVMPWGAYDRYGLA